MALSEEQLEVLGNRLVPLYQKFERAVINDVVRRLVKTERLTETAEIMAETLRDKGFSPAAIRAQVMKSINADKKLQEAIAVNTLEMKQLILDEIKMLRKNARTESEQLWEDAGNIAFHADLSVWEQGAKPVKGEAFEQIVGAMSKRATDELLNLTKSLGFRTVDGLNVRAERIFAHEMNMALVKLSSGAYSYGQAIDEAVRELARSGIRRIEFDSGVTRQVDTAVRNAVMTASAQLAGEITMQNVEQTGVDYVEVSAHWGAREGEGHANHAGWQGKVYRVQGSDGEHDNLEMVTGYPSDPAGLCGYNCRHTFYPFWPGLSEPNEWPPEPGSFEVDGRTYTYYQATQEQRRREREIRALKREEAAYEAAGLKDKAGEAARKIRMKTAEYKDFSEAVGIRAKTERLRVCEGMGSGLLSSGAKKTPGWEDRHAERFYEEVRKRAAGVDAAKIAKYTDFTEEEVEDIRQHMFIRIQPLDNGTRMERFAPDYYQAQAWQRLTEGQGTETDKVLLHHEYLELTEMRLHGYNYDEAHEIANKEFDWWSALVKEMEERRTRK